jgi:myosin heavy subunit
MPGMLECSDRSHLPPPSFARPKVATNPFEELPLYDNATMYSYFGGQNTTPHVFSVASMAVQGMKDGRASQAVCISGESGAGKTETTKYMLRFIISAVTASEGNGVRASLEKASSRMLRRSSRSMDAATISVAAASGDSPVSLESRILQCNPVTEAYGNAKTLRNNNSSRSVVVVAVVVMVVVVVVVVVVLVVLVVVLVLVVVVVLTK